jgi:hypothetical protein
VWDEEEDPKHDILWDKLVSKDIPVQSAQLVRIFLYEIFSQEGCPSIQYSVSKDIPVQNTQSVRIFQYTIFRQ